MKTTSSHLTRGVVIAAILLALSQAWRVGQRTQTGQKIPDKPVAESNSEPAQPVPPSRRFNPAAASIEFLREPAPLPDPWKNPADPSNVWHEQRQRASELLIRHDLPPLKK
ncbi:MAG: hypothetical protein IAE77_30635 [Prosthecobacter sp.]|jgi:hypothetical protein|uniref:hypothetical protein n=1 Tax=Prosthecobacter sp. TaxID=1965333 RepID=UPI001A080D58|nr:hypothetical protein [Prosthecobacter sp.]MBE2287855.1 hypothetical protein [Prosthecobacter sp.]